MNDTPPSPSRLLKVVAASARGALWLLVAFWLLLALAWGALHGWIVPKAGDLRPWLETHATRVVGVPVRIGAVHAWSDGLLPTVRFDGVVLLDRQGREALRLPQVVATVSPRSLWRRGFDQLYVDGPVIDVRRTVDGRVQVAGLEVSAGQGDGAAADWFFRQPEFVIRSGVLRWTDELLQAPLLELSGVDLVVRNSGRRHAMRLDATPPAAWGERFTLQGVFRHPLLSLSPGRWRDWDGQVHALFRHVDLQQLRRHAPPGIEVAGGQGGLQAWVDVVRGEPVGGAVDLAVTGVETRLAAGLEPLQLDQLSGRIAGKRQPGGFELETRGLQFTTGDGQRWPGGNLFLAWSEPDGRRPGGGELRADRLDLRALGQLAGRLPLSEASRAALARHAPEGLVESVQARWQGPLQAPASYSLKGKASGIALAAVPRPDGHAGLPGVRGATLDFDLTDAGGRARLQLQDGALELPGVFADPVLALQRLAADLQWQRQGERWSASASNVRFANDAAQGEATASWRTGDDPAHRLPGVLDLQGTLARADGTQVWRYLPLAVPQASRDYVREAVQGGTASDVRFKVKGNLHDFPFPKGKAGEFRLTAQVHDATYQFVPRSLGKPGAPPWPALTGLTGQLVFDRASMRVENAEGRFAGAPNLRLKASAAIADLARSTVDVNGEVRGPLAEMLGVVQRSPVSALTQDALGRATGTGAAELKLQLALPVAQIASSKVQGTVTLAGNDVQLVPEAPLLGRARGSVAFNERGFSLSNVTARALGGDVRLEGGSRSGPNEPAVLVRAQGVATADGLRQARELGPVARLARLASGQAAYTATLAFRRGSPDILVTSSLQGLALNLPAPLGKTAEAALPLRYETSSLAGGGTEVMSVELGRVGSATYVLDVGGSEPRVLRGAIALGLAPGETVGLPDQGVAANVTLGAANVDAWEQVLAQLDPPTAGGASGGSGGRPGGAAGVLPWLPTTLAVRARELTVEGRTLRDVVVGGTREGTVWRGNVDAQELSGYLEYRQPLSGGAGRVQARLSRLAINAQASSAVETLLEEQLPGSIPALDVVVEDFELRGKKLGRLEIDAVNRGGGTVAREGGVREWRLNRLSITNPDASFTATGNWAAVDAQALPAGVRPPPRPAGERRRTVMNFRLDIADGGALLGRLGMAGVVQRGAGRMEGQVAWIGSPLAFDYPSMTGAFHVNVERGQFLKAEPGLAKLLGVLSLQSLPRRLTLDFRDVFSQGFAFDFVRGDVTIAQGVAATNNLQMRGVNAAVLMEGRADLARETQDLRVAVVPELNAGTASLVAVAINPAIGLGTFLAQMFLREPLARATTQQFHIDGTWSDPRITRVARGADAADKPGEEARR
jgi:uncharacterized protein (TIGR02099 family)